jgi:hypothetical protein
MVRVLERWCSGEVWGTDIEPGYGFLQADFRHSKVMGVRLEGPHHEAHPFVDFGQSLCAPKRVGVRLGQLSEHGKLFAFLKGTYDRGDGTSFAYR